MSLNASADTAVGAAKYDRSDDNNVMTLIVIDDVEEELTNDGDG